MSPAYNNVTGNQQFITVKVDPGYICSLIIFPERWLCKETNIEKQKKHQTDRPSAKSNRKIV